MPISSPVTAMPVYDLMYTEAFFDVATCHIGWLVRKQRTIKYANWQPKADEDAWRAGREEQPYTHLRGILNARFKKKTDGRRRTDSDT